MSPAVQKKRREPTTGNDLRKNIQLRLETEKREELTQEAKERIKWLEEQLTKKSEDLEKLSKEDRDRMGISDRMDIDTVQDDNGTDLPQQDGNSADNEGAAEANESPAAEAGRSSVPVAVAVTQVKQEDDDGDQRPLFPPKTADTDVDNDKALYFRPGPPLGQQVKTVGWSSGRSRCYVNMYGKKSAAKYRLEGYAESAAYEDELPPEQNVSNSKIRYGDEKNDNGKYKYTKRHVGGIYGVAWKGGSPSSDRDLDLINPAKVTGRWPVTYVLIAWLVGDRTEKKWEPRAALRVRWGKKDADDGIYKAAVEQENRYIEATTGKRPATSRSPSVGLAGEKVEQFRQQSLPPESAGNTPKSHVRFAEPKDLAQVRQDFLASYCELAGVQKFADLSTVMQGRCLASWKATKEEWMAT